MTESVRLASPPRTTSKGRLVADLPASREVRRRNVVRTCRRKGAEGDSAATGAGGLQLSRIGRSSTFQQPTVATVAEFASAAKQVPQLRAQIAVGSPTPRYE